MTNVLSWLIFLPLIGAVVVMFLPEQQSRLIKGAGLVITLVAFALSLFVLGQFDSSTYHFQMVESVPWVPALGITYKLGIDGVFIAGLKHIADYEKVGAAFKGQWNAAAIFQGGTTPFLSPAELHTMGFSQVAYPNLLIGRVAKAVETGLSRLRDFSGGKADAFKDSEGELALKSGDLRALGKPAR